MASPSLTFEEVNRNTDRSKPPISGSESSQRDYARTETNELTRDAGKARKLGGRLKFWSKFREGQKRYVRRKSESIDGIYNFNLSKTSIFFAAKFLLGMGGSTLKQVKPRPDARVHC
jgi:hypothetical protein